ncbi:hypothetical protein EMIT0P294_20113 [Pseudomonas sp. IT-P294]
MCSTGTNRCNGRWVRYQQPRQRPLPTIRSPSEILWITCVPFFQEAAYLYRKHMIYMYIS